MFGRKGLVVGKSLELGTWIQDQGLPSCTGLRRVSVFGSKRKLNVGTLEPLPFPKYEVLKPV